MQMTDFRGLFFFTSVIAGTLAVFSLYRMARRDSPPVDDQGQYVLLAGTSPAALELDPRGETESESDHTEPETDQAKTKA